MTRGVMMAMQPHCLVVGDTVTALCIQMDPAMNCMDMTITNIPTNQTSISGTLTTTNIIMANWSKEMWQSVLNRAVRMLASGPFAAHFFAATAVVN
ncbi:hypothetical protein KIN20_001970 [Parelaphostrongylus tenuis]|uniref:Uncharacterized protein n=1 Tax=Parelaphostrongylus tenuis TaxID=148309 RepID=A0AAD5MDL3_PARTN|nr:hypothetical protein KIN20_001970 [Parelaphostrongylus tenuis]